MMLCHLTGWIWLCEHYERQGRTLDTCEDWNSGEPRVCGWYDCIDEDGNELRLQWFQCLMNPRKRYWKDESGQKVVGKIRWTGEPSASSW